MTGRGNGFSLLEACLVLAILALLGGLAAALDSGGLALGALQGELRASLEQGFLLARARGRSVCLGLQGTGGELPPLLLPPGVRWGLGVGVPLPPGMAAPVRAHLAGQAHPLIALSPRGTATASVWFLHRGRHALCLRLSGRGRIQLLRWLPEQGRWRGG